MVQEHEANERFNPGWLEDENERVLLEVVGSCITPLCSQPGRVAVTSCRIYFQPFNVVSNNPIQTYQMDQVIFLPSPPLNDMPADVVATPSTVQVDLLSQDD